MNVEALYQDIILEHYKAKHHSGLREPYQAQVTHVNPTCGDEITVGIAVADDGTIYIGSNDGLLRALHPDGTVKWSHNFSTPTTTYPVSNSPALALDGTIYVKANDGYLYALDPADGTTRWRTNVNSVNSYASPIVAPDGTIYQGTLTPDNRLYAVNPDGTLKWTYTASGGMEVATPAIEAFRARSGVCQDFAHIMIACLRAMGVAARYVSGYLLTQPAPGTVKLKGSDASHAWVAVYLADLAPEDRWCDLDPTNNRCGWHSPGEDYVTLAIGRDFSDVSPLRGVIHGGASHTLTVGVTVEPVIDDTAASIASQNLSPYSSQTQSQSQSTIN